ncbi:hypothetical protein AC249_AIPGENE12335, partial [Exaiptasia diaphana]
MSYLLPANVLHDNQATKENILKELSELTKSCE